MNTQYPDRPRAKSWIRYACMLLGFACILSAILNRVLGSLTAYMFAGGLLVGTLWFAFGMYGGLPLVTTVDNWQPPETFDAVSETHRRGLLVMRRRRWFAWLAIPAWFALMAAAMSLHLKVDTLSMVFLLGCVILIAIHARYALSRCPRCGFGFFARSTGRASAIERRRSCAHCGLSLSADKP